MHIHKNIKVNGHHLVIHTAPKSASTSAKAMLLRSLGDTTGQWTNRYPYWPHNKIPNAKFSAVPAAEYRIGFVRDPVSRFISGYRDIVVMRKQCNPTPTITEFIDNFDYWMKTSSSVNHHFSPQVLYLGTDPTYYTHIFTSKTMDEYKDLLSSLFGFEVTMLHLHSTSNIPKPSLTIEQVDWIKKYYEIDYQTYGDKL
jgi:hypothetical protein